MDENLMQPEQFTDITRQIIAANGDQGAITALLTQLQDGYSALFATHADVSKNNQALTNENEKLKEYNLELFMSRGQKVIEETGKDKEVKSTEKERAETITVADLFKKED